jgi:hypothetical protein
VSAHPISHGSKTRFTERTPEGLAHMRSEYRNLCDRIGLLMRGNDPRALREAEDRKRSLALLIAAEERRA